MNPRHGLAMHTVSVMPLARVFSGLGWGPPLAQGMCPPSISVADQSSPCSALIVSVTHVQRLAHASSSCSHPSSIPHLILTAGVWPCFCDTKGYSALASGEQDGQE